MVRAVTVEEGKSVRRNVETVVTVDETDDVVGDIIIEGNSNVWLLGGDVLWDSEVDVN